MLLISEVAAVPTQSSVMKTFMRTFTLLGCETWSLRRKEEHRLGGVRLQSPEKGLSGLRGRK